MMRGGGGVIEGESSAGGEGAELQVARGGGGR